MATSMAAALAASLPAAPAVQAPAAPVYEAIPASMSKAVDVEAEIPVTHVQLDGLVVSKIIKHASESRNATGLLLGLDLEGVMEVANCFPLPAHHAGSDEEDKSSKATARYQASMLRQLKEVQSEDAVVGLYQVATAGALFTPAMVEMQALYQDKLRHGGVLVVHDIAQSTRGNASFKAYKLTRAFLDAHRRKNFSASSLNSHRLTHSSILEEIPLKVHTNALLSSFVSALSETPASESSGSLPPPQGAVPATFPALLLDSASTTRSLSNVIDALDAYKTEENNLAYLSRQIGRERAKAESLLQKRREENQLRVSQGLQPLPEADVLRMAKVPPEPNRLESMLLLGQVEAHARSLESTASAGLAKMYATNASSGLA